VIIQMGKRGMKHKLVYAIVAVAFVSGIFATAYAGPALTNITLGGNVDVVGDAHVAAGKSLFVDTIEPESESFVNVPGDFNVAGFASFEENISLVNSIIFCTDNPTIGTPFDCLFGSMIVAETVTSNEIKDGTITGADVGSPLVLSGDITADTYFDRDNTAFFVNPASTSQFSTVKATIYRDLDDTFFFANPASTSVFKALNVDDVTVANDIICTNCIDSADIAAGAVETSEIADGTIDSADIADDAVTGSKIAGTSKLEFGRCSTVFNNVAPDAVVILNCPHIGINFGDEVVAIQAGSNTCISLVTADVFTDGSATFKARNICSVTIISASVEYNYIIFNIP